MVYYLPATKEIIEIFLFFLANSGEGGKSCYVLKLYDIY